MPKKKSSKKSIKKLHLDKPTSHGGWPDGHSGSYLDPNTPVNKQISKFLSDMGLLDDDNPRARLSEDKIRVKRIVLEGLLKKILSEAKTDKLLNLLPHLPQANTEILEKLVSDDNSIKRILMSFYEEGKLNPSYFSMSNFLKYFSTDKKDSFRKDSFYRSDTTGAFFDDLFLIYLLRENKQVYNLNKIVKTVDFVDLWEIEDINYSKTIEVDEENSIIKIPGTFHQVKSRRTIDASTGFGGLVSLKSNTHHQFVNLILEYLSSNNPANRSLLEKFNNNQLKVSLNYNFVDARIDLSKMYNLKNFEAHEENLNKFKKIIFCVYYNCYQYLQEQKTENSLFAVAPSKFTYSRQGFQTKYLLPALKAYNTLIVTHKNLKEEVDRRVSLIIKEMKKTSLIPKINFDLESFKQELNQKVLNILHPIIEYNGIEIDISDISKLEFRSKNKELFKLAKEHYVGSSSRVFFNYTLFIKKANFEIDTSKSLDLAFPCRFSTITIDKNRTLEVKPVNPNSENVSTRFDTAIYQLDSEQGNALNKHPKYYKDGEEVKGKKSGLGSIPYPIYKDFYKAISVMPNIRNLFLLKNMTLSKGTDKQQYLPAFSTLSFPRTKEHSYDYGFEVVIKGIKIEIEELISKIFNIQNIFLEKYSILLKTSIYYDFFNNLFQQKKEQIDIFCNYFLESIVEEKENKSKIKNLENFESIMNLIITEIINYKYKEDEKLTEVENTIISTLVDSEKEIIVTLLKSLISIISHQGYLKEALENVLDLTGDFLLLITRIVLTIFSGENDVLNRYRLNLGIQKNDNSIIINFRKAFTSSSIPPNPDEVETTQIPDSNIEIAADPEEHEEDKEDLAMVAESKLYKMVLKDLFEYLNR